jgi:TldD protein
VTATAAPTLGPAVLDAIRPPRVGGAPPAVVLEAMTVELARSMAELGHHGQPPYFASYEVTDTESVGIAAQDGALAATAARHHRSVDVDVRAGDYKLDNTHALRGTSDANFTLSAALPVEDDAYAIRSILWLTTDRAYKRAVESLQKAQANTQVKAEADDTSDDFSHETRTEYLEPPATLVLDRAAWEQRLRALSAEFRRYPTLVRSGVSLEASAETHYFVSSDGARYQVPAVHLRVRVQATTIAPDGAELARNESFDVASPAALPTDDQIRARIDQISHDLVALAHAPASEPYLGPAILEGKAAGVFFHEVFGHRIEGHRQKDDTEGQTFAKKINQPIMPAFISVYDDPSIATLDGQALNGFYRFDDEGTPGVKASLVEAGVLKTFLLGRSPTRGFVHSNGHGRRSEGHSSESRQGNLIVAPSQTVSRAELQRQLLAEVKQQGLPYGLVFRELDGGFTMTRRFEPQAFKLLSIMVSRVYPDGHEQLLRGADLEGTPLRALADIKAAADDVATFNGYCGAESGFVPVSATSPSLLIAHVEVARKPHGEDKPPILAAPPREQAAP